MSMVSCHQYYINGWGNEMGFPFTGKKVEPKRLHPGAVLENGATYVP